MSFEKLRKHLMKSKGYVPLVNDEEKYGIANDAVVITPPRQRRTTATTHKHYAQPLQDEDLAISQRPQRSESVLPPKKVRRRKQKAPLPPIIIPENLQYIGLRKYKRDSRGNLYVKQLKNIDDTSSFSSASSESLSSKNSPFKNWEKFELWVIVYNFCSFGVVLLNR